MNINIGNFVVNIGEPKDAMSYHKLMSRIAKGLFQISGIHANESQVWALGVNLHRFLIENKDFVVGVVNAGKVGENDTH